MEINTQQMEAVLQLQEQQAQSQRKNSARSQDFGAILNRQLTDAQNTDTALAQLAAGDTQAIMYSQLMLNPEMDQKAAANMPVLQSALDQASGALDMWDTYTSILGGDTNDSALRDAYSLLEGIDSRVSQLKANPAIGANPELGGILNELEIMTVTEKFKFNRGDYIA